MPGVLSQAGFAGSIRYCVVYVLFRLASLAPPALAAVRNVSVAETEFVYTRSGVQRRAVAVAYARIVLPGSEKITRTLAPDAFRRAICDATLVAVVSWGSLATMFDFL